MKRWTTDAWLAGTPEEVLDLLTEPEAIARWSPVDFEVAALEGDRLVAGACARVRVLLAGRPVEFAVDVLAADDQRLALVASGPLTVDVEYALRRRTRGSLLRASISVSGRGAVGRLLAQATEAMLAAGALDHAIDCIERELEPAVAAA